MLFFPWHVFSGIVMTSSVSVPIQDKTFQVVCWKIALLWLEIFSAYQGKSCDVFLHKQRKFEYVNLSWIVSRKIQNMQKRKTDFDRLLPRYSCLFHGLTVLRLNPLEIISHDCKGVLLKTVNSSWSDVEINLTGFVKPVVTPSEASEYVFMSKFRKKSPQFILKKQAVCESVSQ